MEAPSSWIDLIGQSNPQLKSTGLWRYRWSKLELLAIGFNFLFLGYFFVLAFSISDLALPTRRWCDQSKCFVEG